MMYCTQRRKTLLAFAVASMATVSSYAFLPPLYAASETDFVREFAKNRSPLRIVVSGPEAQTAAHRLTEVLHHSRDFAKHPASDLEIVTLANASSAPSPRRPTTVYLLTGHDLAGTGNEITAAVSLAPLDIAGAMRDKVSVVRAVRSEGADKPGELTFRVGLYAPDAPRLNRLLDELLAHKAEDFRQLPFTASHTTNRVRVFSPLGWEKTLDHWGEINRPETWNDCHWYPITERVKLTPEQMEDATEVYLVDRSRVAASELPEAAARVLSSYTMGATTTVVAKGKTDEGRSILVISAPSRMLLFSQVSGHSDVRSLENLPPTSDALNLTRLGSTSLLILGNGGGITPDLLTALHGKLARTLREEYHVAVEPRGTVTARIESDLALQMAQGVQGTQGMLQRRYPTRYVWAFTLTDAGGGTVYRPDEKRLTPLLSSFDDIEPDRPLRKKEESDDDYDRRRRDYRERWDRWDRARRDHDTHYENDTVEWELSVTQENSARVHGLLQLIDTKSPNGARVVWEKEEVSEETDKKPYRTRRTMVKGYDTQPSSLDAPHSVDTCPSDLLLTAALHAGTRSLEPLWHDALLDETAPTVAPAAGEITPATTASPIVTGDSALTAAIKVAEIDGKTVTLNGGTNRGIRVGDRFEVLIRAKETLDPDTGRVLRVRVFESCVVVITHVDAEVADAVPATSQDATKLATVKSGMVVRRAP